MIKSNRILNLEEYREFLLNNNRKSIDYFKYRKNLNPMLRVEAFEKIISLVNNDQINVSFILFSFYCIDQYMIDKDNLVYDNDDFFIIGIAAIILKLQIMKFKNIPYETFINKIQDDVDLLDKDILDDRVNELKIMFENERVVTSFDLLYLYNLIISNEYDENRDIAFQKSVSNLIELRMDYKNLSYSYEDLALSAIFQTFGVFNIKKYEKDILKLAQRKKVTLIRKRFKSVFLIEDVFYNNRLIPYETRHNLKILYTLGRGSYGTVYRTKSNICLKQSLMTYYKDDSIDNEIDKLVKLQIDGNSNYSLEIINAGFEGEKDIYYQWYTTKCKGQDLFIFFNKTKKIKISERLYIMKHILLALKNLKSSGIVHSDIKSSNILFDKKTRKLYFIDFGLSFFEGLEYTNLDLNWFNTPPEILGKKFDKDNYTYSIDIWYTGLLFLFITTGKLYTFNSSWKSRKPFIYINSFNDIKSFYNDVPNKIKDLIFFMLDPNSETRITVEEALKYF